MPASAYADWPKVELHFHLEGAIPLPTLWTLVQKYGGDPQVPDQHALVDRFSYQDFPHFLRIWNCPVQEARKRSWPSTISRICSTRMLAP